jgi:hypothetical protein
MTRRRSPHAELQMKADQGGGGNPQYPGLRAAALYIRNLFGKIPGEGEAFVTETGKLGRLGPSQMCGSAPHGMRKCYPVTWAEDYGE